MSKSLFNHLIFNSLLVLEYIRPSMRTFGLNLCIGIFYCLGSMITPWIAVYLGSWKLYLIYTSMPIAIVPFFYFILPESAQWLLSKNDVEGAIVCFRRVARFNGRILDDDTIEMFRAHHKETMMKQRGRRVVGNAGGEAGEVDDALQPVKATLFDLFKTKRLRRHTLILFFKS